MAVSYNRLWKLLIDKTMSKADLRKAAGLAPNTMTKLRRDEPVALQVLEKICSTLNSDLGLLEAFGVLRFKSLGGSNSQIYINVRETKNMQIVRDTPNRYRNKLLELINDRHHQSVEMLQYLFHGKFESAEIWEHLENYFLGIMPPALSNDSNSITIDDETAANLAIQLCVGENLQDDYENWALVGELFDNPVLFE